MTSAREWVLGARPRTLPAAVVPVVIGASVATNDRTVDGDFVANAALALAVSLALQVGVNYANDYSDGVRGTDDQRRGPLRLVGSGIAEPAAVRRAALAALSAAALVGLLLAARTSWWLVLVGIACVVAAWTYTGGPKPYGYAGLGEVFVFVFFGLVATAGTAFVAGGRVTALSLLSGAVAGFLAVALLLVNNIRDIEGDRASGKKTLAVRVGEATAKNLYAGCFGAAAICVLLAAILDPLALVGLAGLLAALPAVSTVKTARTAEQLIAALGMTARSQLVVGVLYSVGLAIQ